MATWTTDRVPRRREAVLAGLLLCLALLLRLANLTADPIQGTEGGFLTDWGEWWKNARLRVLLGTWTVDDFNIGLYLAPLYSAVLAIAFATLGVAYATPLLVSVASGLLSAFVVYVLVRQELSARAALMAAFLLLVNPTTVVHDRSAYPESFQLLWLVAAFAGVFLGTRSRAAALVGGLALVGAFGAKVTGLIAAPIVAAAWLSVFAWAGPAGRRTSFRALSWYLVGAVLGSALLAPFLLQHRSDILLQVAESSGGHFAPVGQGARAGRVPLIPGWPVFGLRLNEFFREEWYLCLAVAVLASLRVARNNMLKWSRLEAALWLWIAGVGVYCARLFYQPDRRFLILVPPIAMMVALHIEGRLSLGPSRWASPLARRVAHAGAGAMVAAAAAFFALPWLVYKMMAAGRLAGESWTYEQAGSLVLVTAALGGATLGAVLAAHVPRVRALRVAPVVLAVVGVGVLAWWAPRVLHPRYTLRSAIRLVMELSAALPPDQRYLHGGVAATLVMGSDAVGVSAEVKDPSAVERFDVPLAILVRAPADSAPPEWVVAGQARWVTCAAFPLLLNRLGQPRRAFLGVRPELLARCREIVTASRIDTLAGLPGP